MQIMFSDNNEGSSTEIHIIYKYFGGVWLASKWIYGCRIRSKPPWKAMYVGDTVTGNAKKFIDKIFQSVQMAFYASNW